MSLIAKIAITPDKEDKKTQILFKQIGNIKKRGYLTKTESIKILKWKSARPFPLYNSNSESDFRKITKAAFSAKDDRIKIQILTVLNGVKYPCASAILMFYDKRKYGVIDIRVWKQLYKAKYVNTNPRGQSLTLNEWGEYLRIIRIFAQQLGLTPRQIEKRLYDIDKVKQKKDKRKVYG